MFESYLEFMIWEMLPCHVRIIKATDNTTLLYKTILLCFDFLQVPNFYKCLCGWLWQNLFGIPFLLCCEIPIFSRPLLLFHHKVGFHVDGGNIEFLLEQIFVVLSAIKRYICSGGKVFPCVQFTICNCFCVSFLPSTTISADRYCHCSMCQPVCQCVCTSIHLERCYHSNSLKISAISWILVGWYTVPFSRSLLKMVMLSQILAIPRNLQILHDRIGRGLRNDITTLTPRGFHLWAWNLVRWCTVS